MDSSKPLDHLRCVVERITYQSDGYSVLKCTVKGEKDLVTVVGTMPDTHVGSVLTLGGHWKIDSKYGRQFAASTFEETLPATVYGIEKYLGSGLIKGIGPKYAKLIVNTFGKDTLDIIESNVDRLLEIPGIGKKRVDRIKTGWNDQKEIKNIMLFLQSHDVSTAHATKIYKQYGTDSIAVVQENPYRLADDIWGIGFKTADTIAEKLGFEKDKFVRLRSGLMYSLNKLADEGHCYATRDQLMAKGTELLEVDQTVLTMTLDEMIHTEDVKTTNFADGTAIYLPTFFFSEVGVENRLKKIFATPVPPIQMEISSTTIEYDPIQLEAIQTAAQSKIMILTGGPGTGKSTTTMGIIKLFAGQRVLLAAPTGRAAKRLSEVTGMEAKTIHRLLEFKPPEGYKRNEENPLDGDVLIIDESSMIDVVLMYSLLRAVPDAMRIILVGDIDQLPAVGAGNVLHDMIESGIFPVVKLTRIFRQAASSMIITNAHRINHGQLPIMKNERNGDFFLIHVDEPEEAVSKITSLIAKRLPPFYKVTPQSIQVLTPMQRGVVGAANLNQVLQQAINPPVTDSKGNTTPELSRGGFRYRPNDKVMQIRNNYEKEVFNGDIGIINSVNVEDRTLIITFDDRDVEYDVTELDEITLAYATTVHKAQGAEYPIVIMPVMMANYVMLQRNLLYTGVTRAKKVLVLVGQERAIGCCVRNVTITKRNTLLTERLSGTLERQQRYICFDVETPNASNSHISAIGITVIDDGKIINEFFSYVNPEQPFDHFNTELTGINASTVANAPTFATLWPQIEPLMNSGILVAHNAPFDMGVLRQCLSDYGIQWKEYAEYVCTVRIGRAVLPGISHKLNDLCSYYGIGLDHHKADSDSHACAEILLRYMQNGVAISRFVKEFRIYSSS